MRRMFVALVTAMAVMIPIGVAGADQPAPAAFEAPPRPHADPDSNRLSNALEARLLGVGADEKIEVVVTWNGRVDMAAARAAAGRFDVIREFSIIDGFVASVTPGQARALARAAGVFRVDENFSVQVNNEETDVDYGTEQARTDFSVDGSGINVCVLDTGVDPNHEQLDSRVVGFYDAINGQTVAYDDHDHGTHVSATILGDGVGSSPNAARYQGIAPGAGLYAAKVLSGAGSGTTAQIIDGIEWCVAQPGVRVLSMSLGTDTGSDGLDALSQAVNAAVLDHGMVVSVAAGNAGDGPQSVGSPGAALHGLTVGAASKFGAGLHLAPFSSRGPNLAGVMKPDVTAPGVAVTSADANTTSGYFAASGTSMATPFVAGAVALALDANPNLTPSDVKALVTGTARDLGDPGADPDWGHGLLDGYGLVSAALGGSGSSQLPSHTHVTGSVNANGTWSYPITIAGDEVGEPLGITIIIDGQIKCSLRFFGICLVWEWSPDLDARLIAPNGSVTDSRCALEGDCGATGVQETYHVASAMAGTYTLEVYPYSGSGTFGVDIFTGSAGSLPPGNQPPIADAGPDQTVPDTDQAPGETVSLDGSLSSDPDGAIVAYSWSEQGIEIATGVSPQVTLGDGVHTITLTVTDAEGASDTDEVMITVEAPPPSPNADPVARDDAYTVDEDTTLNVGAPGVLGNDDDPDGDSLTVTSHTNTPSGVVSVSGDGSFSYQPQADFNGQVSFQYTVDDGNGGSATATVTITVNPVNDPPTADAGPDRTVADSDGQPGESVTLDGSGSTDIDGTLTYTWSEGGQQIATGPTPTVVLGDGSHTIVLTVSDGQASDIDTVMITVTAPPPSGTMHVGDLDGFATDLGRGKWRATATVTVHRPGESPLSGATVSFTLSTGGTLSCTTNGGGMCSVSSPDVGKKVGSVTFQVTAVTHSSYSYGPGGNHDPDGSSTGTVLEVNKP